MTPHLQPYLENYDAAIKTLHTIRKTNPEFDFFLKWYACACAIIGSVLTLMLIRNEKCENSSLQALHVMPIQRLPRVRSLSAALAS